MSCVRRRHAALRRTGQGLPPFPSTLAARVTPSGAGATSSHSHPTPKPSAGATSGANNPTDADPASPRGDPPLERPRYRRRHGDGGQAQDQRGHQHPGVEPATVSGGRLVGEGKSALSTNSSATMTSVSPSTTAAGRTAVTVVDNACRRTLRRGGSCVARPGAARDRGQHGDHRCHHPGHQAGGRAAQREALEAHDERHSHGHGHEERGDADQVLVQGHDAVHPQNPGLEAREDHQRTRRDQRGHGDRQHVAGRQSSPYRLSERNGHAASPCESKAMRRRVHDHDPDVGTVRCGRCAARWGVGAWAAFSRAPMCWLPGTA